MTTIAWNETTIAWDSQMTSGTAIKYIDREKVKVLDGKAYALAGDARKFEALIAWEKAGCDPTDYPASDLDVFVVFSGTDVKIYADGFPWTRPYDVFAIGTGGDLAQAVMRTGLDPVKAIELVAEMDIYTGGPINSLTFADVLGAPEQRRRGVKIVGMTPKGK